MSFSKVIRNAMLAGGLVVSTVFIPAQAAPPTAEELLQQVNSRNDGESLTRTMKITMTDRRGKTREQLTKTYRRYYDDGKRSTIFYVEPANIKDTGFLTYDYSSTDKEDDQWLYLPELRRVRRISSSNRGANYLGTDFSYEDMKLDTRLSETDYTYTVTGTDTVAGRECHVMEGIPISDKIAKEIGYSKVKAFIDTEKEYQHKTEMWDVNGNPLKTILWEKWHPVGTVDVVGEIRVTNHKTGHKTLFEFSDIDTETDIDEEIFTERALKRGYKP